MPELTLGWTQTDSTIPLYDRKNRIMMLGLRRVVLIKKIATENTEDTEWIDDLFNSYAACMSIYLSCSPANQTEINSPF